MELIKSTTIPLFGAVSSQLGGRPENQDDYCFADTPLGFLCIVCDGMGGGPGGKTASYIAKTTITEVVCGCSPQTPCDHALRMAIAKANEALEEKMQQVPQLVGMGSTCVAVLITPKSAFVAHTGDSRFYRLHGKKCLYRTNDHSLVGELVQRKALTEEQARVSPQSNVITRGLGSTTNHVPDIQEIPYQKGERFVLCSDGVWGIMPHEELINRLTAPTDVTSLVSSLSAEVDKMGISQGGQHDNHTLVVIELDIDSAMKARRIKWPLFASATLGVVLLITITISVSWFIGNKFGDLVGKKKSNREQYPSDIASAPSSYSENTAKTTTSAPNTEGRDSTNDTSPQVAFKPIATGSPSDTAHTTIPDTTQTKRVPTSAELTQRIIDILNKAKVLKERDSTKMTKQVTSYHQQIIICLDSLQVRYQRKELAEEGRNDFGTLKKRLKEPSLWIYDKPNKEGYHTMRNKDNCMGQLIADIEDFVTKYKIK